MMFLSKPGRTLELAETLEIIDFNRQISQVKKRKPGTGDFFGSHS